MSKKHDLESLEWACKLVGSLYFFGTIAFVIATLAIFLIAGAIGWTLRWFAGV